MKIKTLLFITFILIPMFAGECSAYDYVSHPGNIPLLDDFKTPQLRPGESGTFTFTITNRYIDDMTNVTLTSGIYACGTPYDYKEIDEVKKPPKIDGQGIEKEFNIGTMENGSQIPINFTIKSYSDTSQGTYFVRFQLTFNYNNTNYLMQSRGYFSDTLWFYATSNATKDDPGKVDITILGVDGIIPDSSFKVWEPIPLWPLYVCIIPSAVILSVLAVMFYAQEHYNMFPWLEQGFKYWSGKFHQSWRLFKHRFR